jgi:hypothetical protein
MNRAARRASRNERASGFDALMAEAVAEGAARDLIHAIEAAQAQQAFLEKHGLDPTMAACLDERGEPPKERIAGVDAENRVIVLTRKTRSGPPIWFYATRADGLEIMVRPAQRAFIEATAAIRKPTATISAARAAYATALQAARMCDAAGAPRDG